MDGWIFHRDKLNVLFWMRCWAQWIVFLVQSHISVSHYTEWQEVWLQMNGATVFKHQIYEVIIKTAIRHFVFIPLTAKDQMITPWGLRFTAIMSSVLWSVFPSHSFETVVKPCFLWFRWESRCHREHFQLRGPSQWDEREQEQRMLRCVTSQGNTQGNWALPARIGSSQLGPSASKHDAGIPQIQPVCWGDRAHSF